MVETTSKKARDQPKLWKHLLLVAAIPVVGGIAQVIWSNILVTAVTTLLAVGVNLAVLQYETERNRRATEDNRAALEEHTQAATKVSEALRRVAQVQPIDERSFYAIFLAAVQRASDRVNISYFHNEDPREGSHGRKEYYAEILKTIRRKKGVRFRRIDRGHPNLRGWIEHIVEEMGGCSDFDYAIWLDSRPDHAALELVAVQTIDTNTTFLVAVGRQEARQGFRDIHVESKDFADSWNSYYNRLWDDKEKCVVIMEKGKLRESAFEKVKNHLDGLKA